MHMQVATQRCPHRAATEVRGRRAQFGQDVGLTARPRLSDHGCGLRTDAWQRLPGIGPAIPLALPFVERFDDIGRVPVGHHAAGIFAGTVLVVGDPAQRRHRIHCSHVPSVHRPAAQ